MTESTECEYRASQEEIAEAIKRKGVPESSRGCSRSGENADHLCDFQEITNSFQCPYIRLQNGEISEEEFLKLLFGS